jgi:phage tail-like protein
MPLAEVHIQRLAQDEYLKMNFLLEIEGLAGTGFKTCSGLAKEWSEANTRDGHDPPRARYQRTREVVDPITLTYGVTDNRDELEDWYHTGERKSVVIRQLDHLGNIKKSWQLHAAYPKRLEFSDWDAASDDVQIATMVIRCEDWERI